MAKRSEFQLIEEVFSTLGADRADVLLGVGDDAALVDTGGSELIALCVDTLTAGVHFPLDTPAAAVGYKALAVNLSDLAAMGARPQWALLALSMPEVDSAWLDGFRQGLHALALQHDVALIGGDTTRGALAASVTLVGLVERSAVLRRAGARPGDGIYVSGSLGDAAAGLYLLQNDQLLDQQSDSYLLERLQRPQPRVSLGQALRELASAAIDVSDGLLADLGHILDRSAVGAIVDLRQLPLSSALRQRFEIDQAAAFALHGGDDYELCLTIPAARETELAKISATLGVALTRIGTIDAKPGLRLLDQNGQLQQPSRQGYDHFARST